MAPGTALFFHGNTLHCSAANTSDSPRWTLICCYNAAWNDPYKEHHHPNYTPLEKVDDGMIREYGGHGLDKQRAYLVMKEGDAVSKKVYDEPGMKKA
jgi:ectoine hydroxylase-related dioxygenase (phytanoyl-CoA dioxygenase family)